MRALPVEAASGDLCLGPEQGYLRGVSAAQNLARHHPRDGDNAHDAHLIEDWREGQDEAALHTFPGSFHSCGSHGQQQLNAPLACHEQHPVSGLLRQAHAQHSHLGHSHW